AACVTSFRRVGLRSTRRCWANGPANALTPHAKHLPDRRMVVRHGCRWLRGTMDVHALPHLDIRLLGPVEVMLDGRPVRLNRRRERLLLAALALQRGQVVQYGRIIDLLWGDDPADSAPRLL